jgi:hypothetical protein
MAQTLNIKLSDRAYAVLEQQAQVAGTSAPELASASLERQFGGAGEAAPSEKPREEARKRFEQHFGELKLDPPMATDNESIDADLAREYADTHEDD